MTRPDGRKPGFTLIEVLVVITIMSALFSVAAALLVLMLRAAEAGRTQVSAQMILHQLAAQLRSDAAQASDITLRPHATGWQLELDRLDTGDTQKVVYEIDRQLAQRRHLEGDRLVGQESYRLASHIVQNVEIHELEGATFLDLTIAGKKHGLEPAVFHVEAQLARDLRFQGAGVMHQSQGDSDSGSDLKK